MAVRAGLREIRYHGPVVSRTGIGAAVSNRRVVWRTAQRSRVPPCPAVNTKYFPSCVTARNPQIRPVRIQNVVPCGRPASFLGGEVAYAPRRVPQRVRHPDRKRAIGGALVDGTP